MRMKRAICTFMFTISSIAGVGSAETHLTVYGGDMAVVRILDDIELAEGVQTLVFPGVAERIEPGSVRFSAPVEGISVMESGFRYDLSGSGKILSRCLGREISLVMKNGSVVEGILMSISDDIVMRGGDGRMNMVKFDGVERVVFPESMEDLVTTPTLFLKIRSRTSGKTPVEISYTTAGFSWRAEYNAVMSDDEESMEISSWARIENRCGASFEDAWLKLVSGDVRRAAAGKSPAGMRTAAKRLMEDDTAGFDERGFFEYHVYDLRRKVDLMNAEAKKITLFDPVRVGVKKKFVYDFRKNPGKVSVEAEFMNGKEDGLGVPLPAGKVRVFKCDADGAVEFLGEDTVDHTPRGEKVRLTLGYAHDLVAERKVADARRISPRVREQTVEITLRSRKRESAAVTVTEHLWGSWKVLRKSHEFVKRDAYTIEFPVEVEAGGETKVTYTVRIESPR